MSEKNYTRIVVGTIGALFLIIYGLAWFFPEEYYMPDGYGPLMAQKDHVMEDSTQQEILLLGDSRMKADVFAYELGDNVHNLALSASSPIELYYTLKNYMEHHPKPKAVFIAFAPMHYQVKGYYLRGLQCMRYFDNATIDEISKVIKEYDGKDYTNETFGYKYRLPNIYMKPILKGFIHSRWKENTETYQQAKDYRGRNFYEFGNKEMKEVHSPELTQESFICLGFINHYMEKAIELCLVNNIPIYIEQMPMGNPGYDMLVERGYIADHTQYMKQLHDKYQIPVNYDIPVYPAECFFDDSHLNEKSAEKFTADFRKKYSFIFDAE